MAENSSFQPHPLLKNCHLQTLWTRLASYKPGSKLFWQSLSLADGDFIDLAWTTSPQHALQDEQTPLVVIFHGLEGSVYSPYADHLMQTAHTRGWHAVTFHFRGCSGRLNRSHRAYHSGDTSDARYFLQQLASQTNKPLVAAGFSLGGNMLVKLLGETPDIPLKAAVSVSAPLALGPSSVRIDQGFSRVYRGHLLGSLKRKVLKKIELGQLQGFIDLKPAQLRRLRTFREFDDQVTAPLHGFQDVDDYYSSCSGLKFLPSVRTPLLIIHAADDPFTCKACIPPPDSYPAGIVTHQLTQSGGHVGFVGSRRGRPYHWLSERILNYFETSNFGKSNFDTGNAE
ncbi:hydrolase [Aliidiomarina soli]|uniref:Hydrolase n=1 Tax=Aliidiomarina soli TaxID=1928574 RepID=A0A432WJK3_9GAMM|nr:hydrolase [Aliidiomarina soli]RUO33963.1 hydrolase [Aliidiomarina soli]